jgi:hypothetical protein
MTPKVFGIQESIGTSLVANQIAKQVVASTSLQLGMFAPIVAI